MSCSTAWHSRVAVGGPWPPTDRSDTQTHLEDSLGSYGCNLQFPHWPFFPLFVIVKIATLDGLDTDGIESLIRSSVAHAKLLELCKQWLHLIFHHSRDCHDEETSGHGHWLCRRRLDGTLTLRVSLEVYSNAWHTLEKVRGLYMCSSSVWFAGIVLPHSVEGSVLVQLLTQVFHNTPPPPPTHTRTHHTGGETTLSSEVRNIAATVVSLAAKKQSLHRALCLVPCRPLLVSCSLLWRKLNCLPDPGYCQLVVEVLMVLGLVANCLGFPIVMPHTIIQS